MESTTNCQFSNLLILIILFSTMIKPTLFDLLEILQSRGHEQYGGEAVTQLEHALQCATLAQENQASPELITACLFHDLGHLVHNLGENAAKKGVDDRHEYRAIRWLKPLFSEAVTEPIRLHVEAKRYLCAVDSDYYSGLSANSRQSLKLQGGRFSIQEIAMFVSLPYAKDAIQLRRLDEAAKIPERITPFLEDFMAVLETSLRKQQLLSVKSG
jgi:phosphonate degradation associated HDIG domain protein